MVIKLNDIVNAISTVGFPIVVCIIMIYLNEKQDSRHREEVDKMTLALNNNTVAIQQILEHMRGENNGK